nr:MAG TPA: hypothetical protein [Caudoviricetes sp.]
MKTGTAAARANKKYLTIRIDAVYSITFNTQIVTFTGSGSRFDIFHKAPPLLCDDLAI